MADIQLTADGSQAIRTLQQVQKNVDNLGGKFKTFARDATSSLKTTAGAATNLSTVMGRLGGVIAGIGVGAFIGNINRAALELRGISNASEVSIETISKFSQTVTNLGGDARGASADVVQFIGDLKEAADGGEEAQTNLQKVGVSLDDLRRLSNEDIFKKTIQGLANIEDASTRNALAIKMLGGEMKKLDVRDLAAGMNAMNSSSVANASAIKAAADAQKSLNTNLQNLTSALTNILEPFNKMVASIDISVKGFEAFIQVILGVAAAVGSLMILSKFESIIIKVLNATKSATGVFAVMGVALKSLGVSFKILLEAFKPGYDIFTRLISVVTGLVGVFLRFAGIAGLIYSVAIAIDFLVEEFFKFSIIDTVKGQISGLTSKLDELWTSTKRFMGFSIEGSGRGDVGGKMQLEYERKQREELKKQEEDRRKVKDKIAEAVARENLETKQLIFNTETTLYQQRNAIAFESDLLRRYKLKNQLSEEQVDIQRAQQQSSIEELAIVRQLEQARAKLKLELTTVDKDNLQRRGEIKAEIDAIGERIKKTQELYKINHEGIAEVIREQHTVNMLVADQERRQQNIIDAIERQVEAQRALGEAIQSANDKMVDIRFESAQMSRSPLQRQIAEIQEQGRKAALEAGRAFAANFADEDLSPQRARQLADGLGQIALRYREITDAQLKNLEISRTWSHGWDEAFKEYVDSATNAANVARQVFQSVTSNMERMIDNFVDTGKLSFRDMASSIIKDLIKIEMKAQAMELWKMLRGGSMGDGGGGSGGGSMGGSVVGSMLSSAGSWLAGLLGFANGGTPPLNKPSIVGERGAELFMPRSAGTIIPNHKLGMAGGAPQVHNTYITNNISALDAKSVAQLLQENKRQLFGIVESARREMPGATR